MSVSVRRRDNLVFHQLAESGKQSVRRIALKLKLSKDSVSRSLAALDKRKKHHRELSFFETEAGQKWYRKMVIAMLLIFGLKGN